MMSFVLTELRETLEAWCQSYVQAFCGYDAPSIAAHWTFPALTTAGGRSFSFKSAEHFEGNTDRLLEFYRKQDVAKVERNIVDCGHLAPGIAHMTVQDTMLTQQDAIIASWEAAYVLQSIDGQWKAVMAVADGEMAAWAARGTPLGG